MRVRVFVKVVGWISIVVNVVEPSVQFLQGAVTVCVTVFWLVMSSVEVMQGVVVLGMPGFVGP